MSGEKGKLKPDSKLKMDREKKKRSKRAKKIEVYLSSQSKKPKTEVWDNYNQLVDSIRVSIAQYIGFSATGLKTAKELTNSKHSDVEIIENIFNVSKRIHEDSLVYQSRVDAITKDVGEKSGDVKFEDIGYYLVGFESLYSLHESMLNDFTLNMNVLSSLMSSAKKAKSDHKNEDNVDE